MPLPLTSLAQLQRMIDDLPSVRLQKEYERLTLTEAARYANLHKDAARIGAQYSIDRQLVDRLTLRDTSNRYSTETLAAFQKAVDDAKSFWTAESELKKVAERFIRPIDEIAARFATQDSILQRLKREAGLASLWTSRIDEQVGQLARFIRETRAATDSPEPAGAQAVDEATIATELESALHEYAAAPTHESALDVVLGWLKKSRPAVRAALLYILLPYIVSIVANLNTPLYEEWWKEFRGMDPREAKKEIIVIAATIYARQDLRDFRFVTSKTLTVRKSPRSRAPELATLHLGKTVKLLKWDGDWSFVEYTELDADLPEQGWVLSRYIAAFH